MKFQEKNIILQYNEHVNILTLLSLEQTNENIIQLHCYFNQWEN